MRRNGRKRRERSYIMFAKPVFSSLFSSFASRWFQLGYMLLFLLAPLGLTTAPLLLLLVVELVRLRRSETNGLRAFRFQAFWTYLTLLLAVLAVSAVFSSRPLTAAANTAAFALVALAVVSPARRLAGSPVFASFVRYRLLPMAAAGTVVASLAVLFQWLVLHQPRASGFVGPNGAGTAIILGSALGLGWLLSLDRPRSRLAVPFAILSLAAVIATLSRGAWIGFFTMLAVFALRDRRAALAAAALASGFALAVFVDPPLAARFARIFRPELNLDRIQLWQTSLRMLADHPVFGLGTGVFPYVYPRYSAPGALTDQYAFAHNIFLQLALDGGIPALAAFAALVVETARRALRLWRSANPAWWGFLAAFAGVMVHQQVDLPVYGLHIGGGFWALLGLIAALGDERREAADKRRDATPDAAVTARKN